MTQPGNLSRNDAPSLLAAPGGSGATTQWVVAVMTCLATIAVAVALALTPAAAALSGQIAGRATIQIVEPDVLVRRESVAAIRNALADAPFVGAIRTVPDAELAGMAAQWLGDGVASTGLPLPALIDVDLVGGTGERAFARLTATVRAVAPQARVIAHADWLGPVAGLLKGAGVAATLFAVMLVASAVAVAVLAARSALTAQRSLIDVLHLVGATDVQIARLFQRRTARDTFIGAAAGTALAIAVGGLAVWQLQMVASGLVTVPRPGAILLALIVPLAVVGIAVVAARHAVLASLRALP
jgi:cell division transport system permease protein